MPPLVPAKALGAVPTLPYKARIATDRLGVRLGDSDRGAARIGLATLLLGAAFISLAPICVRLSELAPVATAFYRILFALPALWLWLGIETKAAPSRRRPIELRDHLWLALVGLLFAGDLAAWHWSIAFTSVANATLFANSAPIYVTIGAWLLLGERIRPGFLFALGLALIGVVLLVSDSLTRDLGHLVGDGLGLLTGAFYGAYLLTMKRLRSQFSTATVMAWSALPSCLALLFIALLSGEGFIALSLYGWGVLVVLGLVVHTGGQSLIAYAVAHLPASFASVGLLLQPVLAAMLAWIILAEAVSPLQGSGAAMVLAGIAIARRYSF